MTAVSLTEGMSMGVDPVEQWLGLQAGDWPWALTWSLLALGITAIGVILAMAVGRVRNGITEENTRIREWVFRGHLLLPKSRLAEARRSLSTTAQWMIVLGALDLSLRVVVQVFPSDWGVCTFSETLRRSGPTGRPNHRSGGTRMASE